METKGLLISVPDTRVGGRPRKFYRINPMIIQSLETTSEHIKEERSTVELQLTLIRDFLVWLEESCASDEKRKDFIVKWSFIGKFDFITFLLYLKEAALLWELYPQKIPSASQTKKKLSQHIDKYILKLKYKFEVTQAFMDIVLRSHGF
jgi:DNA-binding PadR family transcriptional regulator